MTSSFKSPKRQELSFCKVTASNWGPDAGLSLWLQTPCFSPANHIAALVKSLPHYTTLFTFQHIPLLCRTQDPLSPSNEKDPLEDPAAPTHTPSSETSDAVSHLASSCSSWFRPERLPRLPTLPVWQTQLLYVGAWLSEVKWDTFPLTTPKSIKPKKLGQPLCQLSK
jgi:hypothetical protein